MAHLPYLSKLTIACDSTSNTDDAPHPPTHAPERGGPWKSVLMHHSAFPVLGGTLGMWLIYFKDHQLGWLPHLLVAESAILRRVNAPPGLGVYALQRFRKGEDIGYYGGKVISSASSRTEAMAKAHELTLQGKEHLLAMRLREHRGWHVVDGAQDSVLPWLRLVNDPRGTRLQPRCILSEYGLLRADRDIAPLDWTRPLVDQVASELTLSYGEEYWKTHDALGTSDLPLHVDALMSMLGTLDIGAPRRSARHLPSEEAPIIGPIPLSRAQTRRLVQLARNCRQCEALPLPPVERDGEGRVVYVDLESKDEADEADELLVALREHLTTLQPPLRLLERQTPINRGRILIELEDTVAVHRLQSWLRTLISNGPPALRQLMEPLGDPLRLLGAQWIVPKVTEYTPRIEPQTPHTDVDVKGEVVSIAIHVKGESMGTLIDAKASIHEENDVINGHGFGRAHTSAFAYDTGAVHAGPGRSHVPPPYPQYFTDRVFFLLCSDTLDPSRIAQHRRDNGLEGRADVRIRLA
jgi:hypothetical protein